MFIKSLVHCDYNSHAEAYSSFKIKTKYAITLSFTVTFYYSSVCVCLTVEVEHEKLQTRVLANNFCSNRPRLREMSVAGQLSTVKMHLESIFKTLVLVGAGREERGHRRAGGQAEDPGRVCASVSDRNTGEVDAESEPGLLQGFFRHRESLQLLLAVGHVRVLAAPADAVQTGLTVGVAGAPLTPAGKNTWILGGSPTLAAFFLLRLFVYDFRRLAW